MPKTKQYLLRVPQAKYLYRETYDRKTEPPKLISRDLQEIVSAFMGYDYALQSITQGPKVFDTWDLRKKLTDLTVPENRGLDAQFVVLTEDERDLLMTGFKTIDWTFKQQTRVWVTWPEFFESVRDIEEFDTSSAPLEYLEWEQSWEAAQAQRIAERKRKDAELLAQRRAEEKARKDKLEAFRAEITAARLADLLKAGKLGTAATASDIPASVQADIETAAQAELQAWLIARDAKEEEPTKAETPIDTDGAKEA